MKFKVESASLFVDTYFNALGREGFKVEQSPDFKENDFITHFFIYITTTEELTRFTKVVGHGLVFKRKGEILIYDDCIE